jgi:hypothetical protein
LASKPQSTHRPDFGCASLPVRLMRCLTGLPSAPQDFDHCPCSRAPELQLVGRFTALNSVFNIIEVLPNNIDSPVTMPVDEASSGNPCDPVHGI